MNSIVRRKKKTLFGRVVSKIESELAPREDKLISPNVSLNNSSVNSTDEMAIKTRRDELKSAKYDNSDIITF